MKGLIELALAGSEIYCFWRMVKSDNNSGRWLAAGMVSYVAAMLVIHA